MNTKISQCKTDIMFSITFRYSKIAFFTNYWHWCRRHDSKCWKEILGWWRGRVSLPLVPGIWKFTSISLFVNNKIKFNINAVLARLKNIEIDVADSFRWHAWWDKRGYFFIVYALCRGYWFLHLSFLWANSKWSSPWSYCPFWTSWTNSTR